MNDIAKIKIKNAIASYIAEGIRTAYRESGLKDFPDNGLFIISDDWYESYVGGKILNIPILWNIGKTSLPHTFEVAIPGLWSEKERKFIVAFQEFQEENPIEDRLEKGK